MWTVLGDPYMLRTRNPTPVPERGAVYFQGV